MRVERYFAYGSNMNPSRVRERGLVFRQVEGARLHDFALGFGKQSRDHAGSGHAHVERAPGNLVEGVLYLLESPLEIWKMDPFERAPINYSREVVMVETLGGRVPAWTYFANPAVMASNLHPRRDYLAHLLAGRPYLSPSYYARLSSWPCVEYL
ncbi:MAG: gamma-glutamylcyclotransferase family protein [Pseudomonadales bacterium]